MATHCRLFIGGQWTAGSAGKTSRADEFTEKLAGAMSSITVGPGMSPTTQLGPLVSEDQRGREHVVNRLTVRELTAADFEWRAGGWEYRLG